MCQRWHGKQRKLDMKNALAILGGAVLVGVGYCVWKIRGIERDLDVMYGNSLTLDKNMNIMRDDMEEIAEIVCEERKDIHIIGFTYEEPEDKFDVEETE